MQIKTLFRSLIFFIVLGTLLTVIGQILQPYKKDRNTYIPLPPNSVDVAHFGTSHFACGTSPMELWDEYGIPSYVVSGNAQTIPFTYLYMKEFLQYQTPKVIVVDFYTLLQKHEAYGLIVNKGFLKENEMRLSLSIEKLQLLKSTHSWSLLMNCLFPLYSYHDRWSSLRPSDFSITANKNAYVASPISFESNKQPPVIPHFSTKSLEPLEKIDEEYLNEIISLANEKNLKLLFIQFPCVFREGIAAENWLERLNTAKYILDQHDIPYIDYNLISNEVSFDYTEDLMDLDHMNVYGSKKVMAHLGKYLQQNYNLPNRRDNPSFLLWENANISYQRTISKSIENASNVK